MGTEGFIRLPVDGTGKRTRSTTATVGGVEVHQQTATLTNNSDIIINPATEDKQNAILAAIQASSGVSDDPVNVFGSQSIAPGVTLVTSTYTVPVGKKFVFEGGLVGGTDVGEFGFWVNGSQIALARNSGSERTLTIIFPGKPFATAGQVVEIKAKNISSYTRIYETTLSGSNYIV